MLRFPLIKPEPDFYDLLKVIAGKKEPSRVLFFEILIDDEVKKIIVEKYFGEKNCPPNFLTYKSSQNLKNTLIDLGSEDNKEISRKYYKQLINFYYRMGHSIVPYWEYIIYFQQLFNNKMILGKDTAGLSRGNRTWAQEGNGLIRSWEDFENFPWDKAEKIMMPRFVEQLGFISKNLPDGMKILVFSSTYEQVMEWLLGYEGLFYGVYDQPDLVEAVFEKVGELVYKYYTIVIPMDSVGAIIQTDDLGFKTSTMLSIKDGG